MVSLAKVGLYLGCHFSENPKGRRYFEIAVDSFDDVRGALQVFGRKDMGRLVFTFIHNLI